MDYASSGPAFMPLDFLREITNGFSEERKLGSGSFGKVYLGVHPYRENIAVKMLYDMPGLDDEQFQNEFKNLTRLEHQNIVRLVGYCHDIQEVQVQHRGKLVLAEKTHRALCLEYMSNGSLDKYLSDECDRYDWQKGYRMIKGICQGLNYLHNEIKPPIYHLDLKPANVLLDENMVPRIADFGMSRLFGDEQTRTTKSSLGTIGYLPPEYITQNLVSSKFDIFSLGVVIIKIMAGRTGYFNSADMSSQEFTTLVQENWTNRLLETSNRRNAYSEQVKICIEIGLSCVQEDRHKRPTIQDIVDRLNETETMCNYAARKDWLLIFQEANRNTSPQYAEDPNDRHQSDVGTLAVDCTHVDDNGCQRILVSNQKEEQPGTEKDRSRRAIDRSTQRDKSRNDEDGAHISDDRREKMHSRDKDRQGKLNAENKKILDAKQLIDMIPRTKEELFSYDINWAVYEKHELHDRMRPWISKKIIEIFGGEESTVVECIVTCTRLHVHASKMLELLESILDVETEMFVLKMWRMLIFEIKKVEAGL